VSKGAGPTPAKQLWTTLAVLGLLIVLAGLLRQTDAPPHKTPAEPRRESAADDARQPLNPELPTVQVAPENRPLVTDRLARTPAALSDSERERIGEILDDLENRGLTVGLQVLDAASGAVLLSHNAHMPLVPASNEKLISTAAALHELGPSYRFRTRFYVRGKLSPQGVLNGDLVAVGGGDPLLTGERLQRLADGLRAKGLASVTGDLIVDDTFFTRTRLGPGWEQDDTDNYYQAPLGAFSAHFNSVWVYVLPGEVNEPVRVATIPQTRYLTIENAAVTRTGARGHLVVSTPLRGERNAVRVEGELAPDSGRRAVYLKIDNPPLYAGMSLRDTLARNGILVGGDVKTGRWQADDTRLFTYLSPPLSEAVTLINKISSNFAAEQILLTAATVHYKKSAGWSDGEALMKRFLSQTLGLSVEGVELKNGSGLGDVNRVPVALLADVLYQVRKNERVGPEYLASLAIAGEDGTLESYFKRWEKDDLFRAKTGSLEQVLALSGYLTGTSGEKRIVSLIFNECRGHNRLKLKADQERLIRILAGEPRTQAARMEH
jgi:D-alanyl-D-alanine carboxypeptidase/D-alanyl-D-alanine-endopeptidase (penicillin-binding protein 4)